MRTLCKSLSDALLVTCLASALPAHAAKPPEEQKPQSERVQTSSDVSRGSVKGAVTQPLRDINVMRTKIPPVLLQAEDDPYAPAPRSCAQLMAAVRNLDTALGDDFDQPSVQRGEKIMSRGTALGAMASLASDVIPMRGWVRKLTGAEKHDREVQNAILAGVARRSYLKGVGEARRCKPPGSPRRAPPPPPPKKAPAKKR